MNKPSRNTPCDRGKKFKYFCLPILDRLQQGEVVSDADFDVEVDMFYKEVWVLLQNKDYAKAVPMIARAKQKYPEYPEFLELEAKWAEEIGKWDIAATTYEALVWVGDDCGRNP